MRGYRVNSNLQIVNIPFEKGASKSIVKFKPPFHNLKNGIFYIKYSLHQFSAIVELFPNKITGILSHHAFCLLLRYDARVKSFFILNMIIKTTSR